MRQAGQRVAQEFAIGRDILRSDFQQIVEPARDHVARGDLRQAADRRIKRQKRAFGGFGQADLDKGHVTKSQFVRRQNGAIARDHTGLLQGADAGRHRCFGQADATGQFRDRQAGIGDQLGKDFPVQMIKCGRIVQNDLGFWS